MITRGGLHLNSNFLYFSLKAIDDLKFQWYGLPSVAGMMLEVGGLQFPASPFGGWYCSVEIVRDILEPNRYNLLEVCLSKIVFINIVIKLQ